MLLDDDRFLSHAIISEQEEMLALDARRQIVDLINSNDFFGIIADETSDIAKIEQMTIVVRTCNDDYKVREDFIGLRSCDEGTKSEALYSYIQDTMMRYVFDTKKLISTALPR